MAHLNTLHPSMAAAPAGPLVCPVQVGTEKQEPVDVLASQEAKGLTLGLTITARPAPKDDSLDAANAVYIGDHQVQHCDHWWGVIL